MHKTLQMLVSQIAEIVGTEFGILDENGTILACSDDTRTGQVHPAAPEILRAENITIIADGVAFRKVHVKNRLEYVLFVNASAQDASRSLSLIAVSIAGARTGFDEKYDKQSFVKGILQNSITPGDILIKSKELHLAYHACRVAFLIRTENSNEVYAYDVISGLFPNKSRDSVIVLDEENIVLVKELKSVEDLREIDKTAHIITDTLNTELMIRVHVGIGTPVDNLRDLGRSFSEAKMALYVGRIFESDKSIVNYNHLGLGRLISQIPTPLCELFLHEVFRDGTFESLDPETMYTIQKFFENNLNVSETSRQLYVHRNTLVYRLNKIQKITGLDLTRFDDAIIFKMAILVRKYLDVRNGSVEAGGQTTI